MPISFSHATQYVTTVHEVEPDDVVLQELDIELNGFIVAYSDSGDKVVEYRCDVHKVRFAAKPERGDLVIAPTKSRATEYVVIRNKSDTSSRKRVLTHDAPPPPAKKKFIPLSPLEKPSVSPKQGEFKIYVKDRGFVRPGSFVPFAMAIAQQLQLTDMHELSGNVVSRNEFYECKYFDSNEECIQHMSEKCGLSILDRIKIGTSPFEFVKEMPDYFFE